MKDGKCRVCRRSLAVDAKFCDFCGRKLDKAAQFATPLKKGK